MDNEKWKDKIKEMCGIMCFVCKSGGGSLSVCGFKNCLKACHAECMGMVKSDSMSGATSLATVILASIVARLQNINVIVVQHSR